MCFILFFCKTGLPKLRSTFDAFLVPTWVHFAGKNPPKTFQKPTPRCTKRLIDFCIVYLSVFGYVLGPMLGPCCARFQQKWSDRVGSPLLFIWVYVIFRFFGRCGAILAPFWLHFGVSGPDFAMILELFGFMFAP